MESIIDHRGDRRAFNHGIPSQFRVVVGLRCVGPFVDMEVLVLEGVRELVRHHHALVGIGRPIRDEKFLAVRVIEPGNLLRQHFHQGLV